MTVKLRGEAELALGGSCYRLAATMESVTELAELLGDPPLHELFSRLVGVSLSATRAALRTFVQSGTDAQGKELRRPEAGRAAAEAFALSDAEAIRAAFTTLLNALVRPTGAGKEPDPGNPSAA